MINSDKKQFLDAINGAAAVYRTEITEIQLRMYWEALKDHSVDDVSAAVMAHVKSAKFFPTPSEIIERIPTAASSKHIGADEAWAIVLTSFDEFETVVMTQEMMDARKAVYQIWADGDTVGARMAFRDAYSRIIQIAGKPVWHIFSGFNAQRRLSAIESAKQLGRLPADYQPNQYILPAPEAEITFENLLELAEKNTDQTDADSKKVRSAALTMLREILSGNDDGGVERRAKERQSFENHREAELSKLAQKMGNLH